MNSSDPPSLADLDLDLINTTPPTNEPQDGGRTETVKPSSVGLVSVVQISYRDEWYQLDSAKRAHLRGEVVLLLRSHPDVICRWFDSGPWTGNIAEFATLEFSDLTAYWNLWNQVREHRLFSQPLARIIQVTLGYQRSISRGLVET